MLTGNMILAYLMYQIIMLLNDPIFIIGFIIAFLVIMLIRYLISIFLYNNITGKVYGILLNLRKEDNYTVIDSINPVNTSLVLGIIGLIFGIIIGVVSLFVSFNLITFISMIVGGFVGTFICVAIVCFLYNFLSPKLCKIKFELTEA